MGWPSGGAGGAIDYFGAANGRVPSVKVAQTDDVLSGDNKKRVWGSPGFTAKAVSQACIAR